VGDIALAFTQGHGKQYLLEHVLHVAEFGTNSLLSVIRLTSDQQLKGEFGHDNVTFRADGTTVGVGTVINKLFYVKVASGIINSPHAAYVTKDHGDAMLWHNRLGHLSLRAVKKLEGSVSGLNIARSVPDTCLCEACILGKLCRQPFHPVDTRKRSKSPMSLIHSDVVGPMQVQSQTGKRYMLVFTDDCTRWSEVYFMAAKSEVFEKFKIFQAKVENLNYGKIQKLRTDGGGEYAAGEFIAYMQRKGITHQVTAPYSSASNGVAERTNRGILDPMRSMIKHAGLPKSYWAEAATVAVYLKNRLIHRILGKTPYEVLHGSKPDVSHLRTFGCLAYVHNPIRQKLDDRARRCIFLGYTETTSIWRLFDLDTKKVLRSRDVKFDETILYKHLIRPISKDNTSKPTTKTQYPPIALPYVLDDGPIAISRTPAAEIPSSPAIVPKPRRIRDDLSIDMKGWQPAGGGTTRSGRQRDQDIGDGNDRALLTQHLMPIALYAEEGPNSFRDALASEDAEAWREVIANEMSALERHQEAEQVSICKTWKTLQWISDAVFRIVQSVRPGRRTGLHKIQAVRPISGLD
jgi:transposase InsO family protein